MADAVERPEDLYAVDLGDFVAERKALAARLRADGDRDAAAAVMAMRKPPRSAWALNVLARTEPTVVEQVLAAAGRVAAAIADGGDELRAAQRDYTRAVTATVDAASDRSGLSGDPLLEQMRATVLAAGADPDGEVAADLRAGTLATDAPAPGFSFTGMDLTADDAADSPAPVRRSSRRRSAEPPADASTDEPGTDAGSTRAPTDVPTDAATTSVEEAAKDAEAAAAAAAAEKEAAAAERAARAAAAAAERRRARERTRLAREIDRRAQRVERLNDVAETAEAAALEARAAATEAADELRTAQQRLEELERPDG